MNYEDSKRAIETHVDANWTDTPVAYQNLPFNDKPDNGPWVRLTIFDVFGSQIAFGGATKLYRYPGFVTFEIYVVENTGTTLLGQLEDKAKNLFRGQTLGASPGVKFENVFAQEQGNDPDGPWFRADVQADFRFDETA